MYIRIKSTPNSPRRSVQVVESVRTGTKVSQKIVRYMGIAMDDQEAAQLRRMGEEFIERETLARLNGQSLFDVPSLPKPGRPARQTLESVLPPSEVALSDVVEETRRVEGPHEVLGHLYDYLRFDKILGDRTRGASMLRDLVIARVMAPDSKRASVQNLQENYGKEHNLDALYRLMDQVEANLDRLKQQVYQATTSLLDRAVDILLFDVTTLYFESVQIDEDQTDEHGEVTLGLRKFGYSKDQKFHMTQVVIALATTAEGLPIGYELFAGNTAEVKTLIACINNWRTTLKIDKVSFVADRALCSEANLTALAQQSWNYVVAMPMRKSLTADEQARLLDSRIAKAMQIDGDLMWVRETTWKGRRLIATYSAKRAYKDATDRQSILDKLQKKLQQAKSAKPVKPAKTKPTPTGPDTAQTTAAPAAGAPAAGAPAAETQAGNAKKLISNSGYMKYTAQTDTGGVFEINTEKVAADAVWDGMHAIVTNDWETPADILLARYRRLWMIEDSFRLIKHNLAVRPIYHFKHERIKAHIGICYLAFALMRHAQVRIKLAQQHMSVEDIKRTLHGVQSSILVHRTTKARYRLPGKFTHDAAKIYRAFGITRNLDAAVLLD